MKAALEIGRWVFLAPIGYIDAPRALGKSLMPDPERAPLVRRAFEEYATGRFTNQAPARVRLRFASGSSEMSLRECEA